MILVMIPSSETCILKNIEFCCVLIILLFTFDHYFKSIPSYGIDSYAFVLRYSQFFFFASEALLCIFCLLLLIRYTWGSNKYSLDGEKNCPFILT